MFQCSRRPAAPGDRSAKAVGGPWRVYAAYDWGNQSWYLYEREDDDERLFAYAQRATLGVQTTVFDRLTLDLGAGAVFDRFFFTGDGYGDNRHDRVAVRGGPFVALQAGLKW